MPVCFKKILEVFKSLSKKVCFVVVLWKLSSQLPEQKEGLFQVIF